MAEEIKIVVDANNRASAVIQGVEKDVKKLGGSTRATGAASTKAGAEFLNAARNLMPFGSQLNRVTASAIDAAQGINALSGASKLLIGFSAMAAGGLAFLAMAAVRAASDQAESQNKANVVFGESVTLINALADESSRSLGQTSRQVLETASDFGNMFATVGLARQESAQMSVTLVRLASDMASFNNQDPSEMLIRLRAGLAGEAEPLRRFGVLLSEAEVQQKAVTMGLVRANQELTEAQKVQARYALILQHTTLQQGDFMHTSDGLANSQRILSGSIQNTSANLGENLLPATAAALVGFKDFFLQVEDGSRILPETITRMTGLVELAFFDMAKAVPDLVESMMDSVGNSFIRGAEPMKNFVTFLADVLDAIQKVGAGLPPPLNMFASFANAVDVMSLRNAAAGNSLGTTYYPNGASTTTFGPIVGGRDTAGKRQDIVDRINARIAEIEKMRAEGRAGQAGPPPAGGGMPGSGAGGKAAASVIEDIASAMEEINKQRAFDVWREDLKRFVESGDIQYVIDQFHAIGKTNRETSSEILQMMDEVDATRKRNAEAAIAEAERIVRGQAGAITASLAAGGTLEQGLAAFAKAEWVTSLETEIKKALAAGLTPDPSLIQALKAGLAPIAEALAEVFDPLLSAEANKIRLTENWDAARQEAWERSMFGTTSREAQQTADIFQRLDQEERNRRDARLTEFRRQAAALVEAATKGRFNLGSGGYERVRPEELAQMAARVGQYGRGRKAAEDAFRSVSGFEDLAPYLLQSVGRQSAVASQDATFQLVIDGQVIDVMGRLISTRQQRQASTLAMFGV